MERTEEEFEKMFTESMKSLDEYTASQVTDDQVLDAKHHKHNVHINKDYFKSKFMQGGELIVCSKCGAISTPDYVDPTGTEMSEFNLCFHCNYWRNAASATRPNRLIIDGKVYSDGGIRPKGESRYLGFGGSVWTIERDGKVWQTNNLWFSGVVPQEFRELMPDNARFQSATQP